MNDVNDSHDDDDDFVLAELNDAELVEQMHDDLYDGLKEEIVEGTSILLERGWSADRVLNESLVKACGSSALISATASCSFPKYCWPPMQ